MEFFSSISVISYINDTLDDTDKIILYPVVLTM